MEAAINRVEAAGLLTIDLEKLLPVPPCKDIDLATFMEEGYLLREKPFRAALKAHDWSQYAGAAVAIWVSTDAIVPPWAYLLVGMHLAPYAAFYAVTPPEALRERYLLHALAQLDYAPYQDQKLLLKGCASVPPAVLTEFFRRVMPVAHLVFYGEACSSVPVYKHKKV